MKGFANASGKVWRYDRVSAVLKLLPPKVIGAERDLYTLVSGEEVSQAIETNWFSPLDGCYGPIFRKIQTQKGLSPIEMTHLSNFLAYLAVRGPAHIRETELRMQQFHSQLGTNRDTIQYHSEEQDHGDDTFAASEEQSQRVSRDRGDSTARNEVLQALVSSGLHLATALLTLQWTVLLAPQGRSFVIGDNPFLVVPPKSHQRDVEGIGPLGPGAATFAPLSTTLCLRMMATERTAEWSRVDGTSVRALNACQLLNSEQYLFGSSDALLNRLTAELVDEPGPNLAEVVIRQAPSISDSSRSLIHMFTKSKIPSEWANRVPLD